VRSGDLMEIMFLGETFFEEKGFPEPLPKTFRLKKGQGTVQIFLSGCTFFAFYLLGEYF